MGIAESRTFAFRKLSTTTKLTTQTMHHIQNSKVSLQTHLGGHHYDHAELMSTADDGVEAREGGTLSDVHEAQPGYSRCHGGNREPCDRTWLSYTYDHSRKIIYCNHVIIVFEPLTVFHFWKQPFFSMPKARRSKLVAYPRKMNT